MKRKANTQTLLSLKEVYDNPCKQQKTIGVIFDATKPFKTQKSIDYVTKLKIVDESLNYDTIETDDAKRDSSKKYIHVFVYSQRLEDAPNVSQIGEIIYLKRFDFEHSPLDLSEVKGKKRFPYSQYYMFEGATATPKNLDIISSDTNTKYKISDKVAKRIGELRKWAKEQYFPNHSIKLLSGFINQEINFAQPERTDVDMILKVKSKKVISNVSSLYNYEFEDSVKNTFRLEYGASNLIPGDIVKVRSISLIYQNGNQLRTNNYSILLKIPAFMYDAKRFHENKYNIVFQDDNASLPIPFYSENEEYFDEKDNTKVSTVIKKKYTRNTLTSKVLDLKTLCNIQALNGAWRESIPDLDKNIYRVQGYIFDYAPKDINNALKKYCQACNMIYDWDADTKKCCNRDLTKIWQLSFALKDESIDDEARYLEVFLFTFDNNGKTSIPTFNPDQLLNNKETDKSFKAQLDKIVANSSLAFPGEFILEPLATQNEVIFRIIDTKFK